MVTGDNKVTALAIAKECFIITEDTHDLPEGTVMLGQEFFERCGGIKCKNCGKPSPCKCKKEDVDEVVGNMEEFKKLRPVLKVLARSRPEDKYLLVTGLK